MSSDTMRSYSSSEPSHHSTASGWRMPAHSSTQSISFWLVVGAPMSSYPSDAVVVLGEECPAVYLTAGSGPKRRCRRQRARGERGGDTAHGGARASELGEAEEVGVQVLEPEGGRIERIGSPAHGDPPGVDDDLGDGARGPGGGEEEGEDQLGERRARERPAGGPRIGRFE